MVTGDKNCNAKGVFPHLNQFGAVAVGVAWLCVCLCGCIGFRQTSKVDDGAVYELNREMYIAEKDPGRIFHEIQQIQIYRLLR